MKAGIAFNYIGNSISGNVASSNAANKGTYSEALRDMEIRLGGQMMKEKLFKVGLDVGIGLPSYSLTYDPGTKTNQTITASLFNLDVNLRAAYIAVENFDCVFRASYAKFGGSETVDPNSAVANSGGTITGSQQDLTIAIGGLWHKDNALGGIELLLKSVAYKNEQASSAPGSGTSKNDPSTVTFPAIRIVAEKLLASWITVRGSVEYDSITTSSVLNNSGASSSSKDYTTYLLASDSLTTQLGFTISIGDPFIIEGVIAQTILFDAPYFISGDSNFTTFNTSISVGYKFNM